MVCENKTIYLKSGSSVTLSGKYTDSAGEPKSVIGIDIYCDFWDPKTNTLLVQTSTALGTIIRAPEVGDPATSEGDIITGVGEYTIYAGSSLNWPKGEMPVDILYSQDNELQHTEDFTLDIGKGRTQTPASS